MAERLLYTQEVSGSRPLPPTTLPRDDDCHLPKVRLGLAEAIQSHERLAQLEEHLLYTHKERGGKTAFSRPALLS